MSLGKLLKDARLKQGMTLAQVAYSAEMSKGYLHALEADKSDPGILLCTKLSVVLGVPVQSMASAVLRGEIHKRLVRDGVLPKDTP